MISSIAVPSSPLPVCPGSTVTGPRSPEAWLSARLHDAVREHADLDAGAVGAERGAGRVGEMRDVALRAAAALSGLREEDVGRGLVNLRLLLRLDEADVRQRGERLHLIDVDVDAQRAAVLIGRQHLDRRGPRDERRVVGDAGLDVDDHMAVGRVRQIGLRTATPVAIGWPRSILNSAINCESIFCCGLGSNFLLVDQRLNLRERPRQQCPPRPSGPRAADRGWRPDARSTRCVAAANTKAMAEYRCRRELSRIDHLPGVRDRMRAMAE